MHIYCTHAHIYACVQCGLCLSFSLFLVYELSVCNLYLNGNEVYNIYRAHAIQTRATTHTYTCTIVFIIFARRDKSPNSQIVIYAHFQQKPQRIYRFAEVVVIFMNEDSSSAMLLLLFRLFSLSLLLSRFSFVS